MIVKRGMEVESDFGRGTVVAITKEWVVIDVGASEVAVPFKHDTVWIPTDLTVPDVDETRALEVGEKGSLAQPTSVLQESSASGLRLVRGYLLQGKYAFAVRAYKEEFKCSLLEAKKEVDRIRAEA